MTQAKELLYYKDGAKRSKEGIAELKSNSYVSEERIKLLKESQLTLLKYIRYLSKASN